jgi:putative radical SAM enzyme (TIGR03279 family)
MTLFSEIDWTAYSGGKITAIEPDSVAAEIGLLPGDELLAINDNTVEDVIDVQYYAAEEYLELLIRRDDEYLLYEAERDYQQSLGLEFAHPTFDTDIRRCNNLCEFCFVLQMAPKFRRTLYIKDDDYRYSFLFGHFVTLTNLSEHDWWRIENMALSPLYVSVHVTDLELRRQFLRNKTAPDIMTQLRWLAERGIEMHTQLVVVPEFNDGPHLERSINELASLWPAVQSISVVPVGLTSHHKYKMRPHTTEEAAETLAYVEALQPQYQERFGNRFVYPTDEWYLVAGREIPPLVAYDGQQLQENGLGMIRRFLDDWELVQAEIVADGRKFELEVTLVTGTLFGPVLETAAAEFAAITGVNLRVQPIINNRLGDTITAAGLLMAGDVIEQLKTAGYSDLVVLPRIIFDHPDVISLDDMTPQQVANSLGVPVALADLMGDIWDALVGESAVFFEPASPSSLIQLDDIQS